VTAFVQIRKGVFFFEIRSLHPSEFLVVESRDSSPPYRYPCLRLDRSVSNPLNRQCSPCRNRKMRRLLLRLVRYLVEELSVCCTLFKCSISRSSRGKYSILFLALKCRTESIVGQNQSGSNVYLLISDRESANKIQ
jgi:hypothetical protein